MPRIFDNIGLDLVDALRDTLTVSNRADFCVGYFNLRGWRKIDEIIDRWTGSDDNCCRLLVGMHRPDAESLRLAFEPDAETGQIDQANAVRLKIQLANDFREQLAIGMPCNADETGLRRLASQIRAKKVRVKLFLRHPLHAKLYLLFRPDIVNPMNGFVGSSNLTLAGLAKQGELNVDVVERDACEKLAKWFEDRWNDRFCLDISDELAIIIEESWAREELIPPYHIYLKMAYHLSREARHGIEESRLPKIFRNVLFEYQEKAVMIAKRKVLKRGGVILGDVVGLGKTLIATALARMLEDAPHDLETLIICPPRLKKMWEHHREKYELGGKVLESSRVGQVLPELKRYRVVLIDESHNLRNKDGARYKAIRAYIEKNGSKCILLSATPYNKSCVDLSNQLRLFVTEDRVLEVRPERYLQEKGLDAFVQDHQCLPHFIQAFEHSPYADDWRELMKMFLVRRTRGFIKEHYAKFDDERQRHYLTFPGAAKERAYFPIREPKTVKFKYDETDPNDQYARLYSRSVVDIINNLQVPRYGLANYLSITPSHSPTQAEAAIIRDLSRAGRRLMGFCRTNLFKRLESSGAAFEQSVKRHIGRNAVFLYAIETGKPLPIGTQDVGAFDTSESDADGVTETLEGLEGEPEEDETRRDIVLERAGEIYADYETRYKKRFQWLRTDLFGPELAQDLAADSAALYGMLQRYGDWDPTKDEKLKELIQLVRHNHPDQKVLLFSQFADTVDYLAAQLQAANISSVVGVTGKSNDPTADAWRFSPKSNEKEREFGQNQIRVLLATDVLSEGQNLQDCAIVVNYDLPWAIIRLIQRAGRVDRIGQQADTIRCYSFMPADGVEQIINLRGRVRQRLRENAEVVGTDESFFEDDPNQQLFLNLYHEKAGVLDGDDDKEVDPQSYALEIWNRAVKRDPALAKTIEDMPDVVFSAKSRDPACDGPQGALVYVRLGDETDSLAWMNSAGECISQSQQRILDAAACKPETPALKRADWHHHVVEAAVRITSEESRQIGGQIGKRSSVRHRVYERVKAYVLKVQGTLFATESLNRAVQDILRLPLLDGAREELGRHLRGDVPDDMLARVVVGLWEDKKLCVNEASKDGERARIICSMGVLDASAAGFGGGGASGA
ncbi:MAG: NgoFVII family restriction endonuclease [Planctomycetes bacterium]|nr:NgoFVII family restriction endonuclease [Planctomycetota bacterium]